jgi:hypothetical protein
VEVQAPDDMSTPVSLIFPLKRQKPFITAHHARACHGHPLWGAEKDTRDKPAYDEVGGLPCADTPAMDRHF